MHGAGRALTSLRIAAITATTELLLTPARNTRGTSSVVRNGSMSESESERENLLRKGILLSSLESILDSDENDEHSDFIRTSHAVAGTGRLRNFHTSNGDT